jgi:signal transduction histidine kinase
MYTGKSTPMKLPVLRSVDFTILMVALLYYLAAEVGFLLAFDQASLPFWPPAGIALALTILYGPKVWPGIAIGSLIITVKNFWFGAIDSVQVLMAITVLITIGRILEPLAGEFLLRKLVNRKYPFSTTIHAFHFVFIGLLISWISAGVTAASLAAVNVVSEGTFITTLFTLWARNVVGILLFTPLLLSFPNLGLKNFTLYKTGELAIFLCVFAGMVTLFNLEALSNVFPYALPFIVIPFLLWLAFRFNGITSIVGFILISLAAIYYTSQLQGPFHVFEIEADSILLLQVYIGVISVSTLVLASAVRERQQAQADLKGFNENLESIVKDRTRALEEEIKNRELAQQTLQHTNEELLKRNTELDNFVYSVSHDLRAPIASILGLINLAKKDKGEDAKQVYLEMMEKSALQQDHFIKEILDQSRNSRLEVKSEPVQFKSLIEEAFEQLDYSNLNGNKLEKIISVEQEGPFYSDKWRLKVILNNVISNSIRYKNGKDPVIRVDAKINEHLLNLSIQDNGKGIKKDHISNLGKMFYRATDEGAGSGLGLYIVKETVHKLHGSLAIESEEGQGTTVRFEIPEASN